MEIPKDLKLECLQVLFRHGARTPSEWEAKLLDLNDPAMYQPYGYGQLTNEGKRQMYKFGCVLRKRYDSYLGKTYYHGDVYARTSDFQRTKMSLQLVLAGLYPPNDQLVWNPELNWMPIPYTYVDKERDTLFQSQNNHKYNALLNHVSRLPDIREKAMAFSPTLDFVKQHATNILSAPLLLFATAIFNVLTSHKYSNKPIPEWCTDTIYNNLKQITHFSFDLLSLTPAMMKENGGPLVKQFIEHMNEKNRKKIYLYSGHDSSLHAFTVAHAITEFGLPNYGSAIIVETYRDSNDDRFVRMLGWSGVDEEPYVLKVAGHRGVCPMQEYVQIVESILPTNDDILEILKNMKGAQTFVEAMITNKAGPIEA